MTPRRVVKNLSGGWFFDPRVSDWMCGRGTQVTDKEFKMYGAEKYMITNLVEQEVVVRRY